MKIQNFFGHFKTITSHRHQVIRYCFKAGIGWQGLRHDLSKYSPAEFWCGVKNYQGGKRSPNEMERELYGYSAAWMHHKGRNKHHFEYWTDYSKQTRRSEPVEMPVNYLLEMVCDRIAASRIYKKAEYTDRSPLEYFLSEREYRDFHPKTSEELEKILTMLAEKGEPTVFEYCRSLIKSSRGAK